MHLFSRFLVVEEGFVSEVRHSEVSTNESLMSLDYAEHSYMYVLQDLDSWKFVLEDRIERERLYPCLGPVYTTVEKSTAHEKEGVSQL